MAKSDGDLRFLAERTLNLPPAGRLRVAAFLLEGKNPAPECAQAITQNVADELAAILLAASVPVRVSA
jgi:hypothetical protein